MYTHCIILQAALWWLLQFWQEHSLISIIILLILLRFGLRWFLGINSIKRGQREQLELQKRNIELLEQQIRLLHEQHP